MGKQICFIAGAFLSVSLSASVAPPVKTGDGWNAEAVRGSGWQVREIKGDLNGDGREDRVVLLTGPGDERRLVVALQENGQWRVRQVLEKWTGCACGRFDADTLNGIKIGARGVVVISMDIGSSYHEFADYRLRWKDDSLVTIGYDFRAVAGMDDKHPMHVSVNLVTGQFEYAEQGKTRTGKAAGPLTPLRADTAPPEAVGKQASELVSQAIGKQVHFIFGSG